MEGIIYQKHITSDKGDSFYIQLVGENNGLNGYHIYRHYIGERPEGNYEHIKWLGFSVTEAIEFAVEFAKSEKDRIFFEESGQPQVGSV